MDNLEYLNNEISKQLEQLNEFLSNHMTDSGSENSAELQHTQLLIASVVSDKDKDLDRILEQQNQLKMIIDRDMRIKSLKLAISEDTRTIENIRKDCLRIQQAAASNRQEQLIAQTNNLEKFQIQQLRSITEDYKRHENILETRTKERLFLEKEIENEDTNREAYLADVEKKLALELRNRQQLRQGGGLDDNLTDLLGGKSSSSSSKTNQRDRLQLTSVDEYAPYGTASNSTTTASSGSRRGMGRGRRRNKS